MILYSELVKLLKGQLFLIKQNKIPSSKFKTPAKTNDAYSPRLRPAAAMQFSYAYCKEK